MSHVPCASAVGSLMYAMVYTRPNIAYVVGVLSRFKEGALDSSEAIFQIFMWH